MVRKKKRIALELGPRQDAELKSIMERYGLDATNTLRTIISRVFREDSLEYPSDYKNHKHK